MENKFSYTYSAEQQEEIKNIRSKYMEPEEDKMAQLRKLDSSATANATKKAILIGVIGVLIMGTGMSCCMVWTEQLLIPGIVLGLAGIGIAALALPTYNKTLKKERDKIAPEVLRLTEELLK